MASIGRKWRESAPANIAVVKYMGKANSRENVALNPSLSLTLPQFQSTVEIRKFEGQDAWAPLPGAQPLSGNAGERFLRFFSRLKAENGISEYFEIRSGNDFPSDCGLASSASSFAALTRAADACFAEVLGRAQKSDLELARISKTGSGSSCRSFFAPWCAWEGEEIFAVESRMESLVDVVVALTEAPKRVSSSEAHRRVASSPLMERRAERASERQALVKQALLQADFKLLAETTWADSWDMHSMFHTATPPFSYFEPATISVLRFVEKFWEKRGFGPAATIDAGPNVHLLCRKSEKEAILSEISPHKFRLLESNT